MVKNIYFNGDYKTLISAASFFARNEESSRIFKQCNDDKKLQEVKFNLNIKYLLGIIFIQLE
jgi:hypothetical protein